VMYGAFCGSFRRWDQEKGMWMLAVLFLVLIGPLYLVLAWVEMFGGRTALWWGIEFFLGTSLLALTMKLLLSVTVYNWQLSQALKALAGKEVNVPPNGSGNAGSLPGK
jgi:hypothetical protein